MTTTKSTHVHDQLLSTWLTTRRIRTHFLVSSFLIHVLACGDSTEPSNDDDSVTTTFSTGPNPTSTMDSSASGATTSSTGSSSDSTTQTSDADTTGEQPTTSSTSTSSSESTTSTNSSDSTGSSSTTDTTESGSDSSDSSSTSSTESTDSTDSDTDSSDDRKVYSAGHGDIRFEYNGATNQIEVVIPTQGATVDNTPGIDDRFVPNQLVVFSDAVFTRPSPDQGFFQPLCVDEGETVQWLPQSNSDASQAEVPFLGIDNAIPEGTFLSDELQLRLVAVQTPTGSGYYSLWKEGFPPQFYHSTCDGIGELDSFSLPPGHDHFNMGFADDFGDWRVRYEVSGKKQDNAETKTEFTIHYRIQGP